MSRRELERKRFLDHGLDRVSGQKDVAEEPKVSERHVGRRLWRNGEHARGWVSQRRGQPSNYNNYKIASERTRRAVNQA
jgi:hypothetical protein